MMTWKSALFVMGGLLLALVGGFVVAVDVYPSGSSYDRLNDRANAIGVAIGLVGIVLFVIGALSKRKGEQ
jgi:hypothetical protein